MTKKKINELSMKERMNHKSPDLFIKLQKWAVIFMFAGPAVTAGLVSLLPDNPLILKLNIAVGGVVTMLGVVMRVVAKLPVDSESYEELYNEVITDTDKKTGK